MVESAKSCLDSPLSCLAISARIPALSKHRAAHQPPGTRSLRACAIVRIAQRAPALRPARCAPGPASLRLGAAAKVTWLFFDKLGAILATARRPLLRGCAPRGSGIGACGLHRSISPCVLSLCVPMFQCLRVSVWDCTDSPVCIAALASCPFVQHRMRIVRRRGEQRLAITSVGVRAEVLVGRNSRLEKAANPTSVGRAPLQACQHPLAPLVPSSARD